jgi:hypothetical protein
MGISFHMKEYASNVPYARPLPLAFASFDNGPFEAAQSTYCHASTASGADRHTSVNILIHEGTNALSGQELYREVATANEAEAASELEAPRERIGLRIPGGPG